MFWWNWQAADTGKTVIENEIILWHQQKGPVVLSVRRQRE